MNIHGIKNRIENLKPSEPKYRITRIKNIIIKSGPRAPGEPPNPIATGEVVIVKHQAQN